MTLEEIKKAIEAAESQFALALAATRLAGQARLAIIKRMEQEKKDSMILIKQQRVDLLKLLNKINAHDKKRLQHQTEIEQLKEEYRKVAGAAAERLLGDHSEKAIAG